ncbi:DUF6519 domain-containing protein [Blastococcus sp. BMG 814]|uniref:DUF6519 domain-containing protein n=1 Tax=Blastococcus carthaginiensis TaxID=3050034 RepID=A0ABT9I7Q3_9ACTN|nr:DUF6519 domain-containing protein [Blastococcus carthaginiensis]MDP5181578.1 DUF6519 domain-containing protein [Blastococcus carthaginiensis]
MHGDFSRWTFDPEQGYRSVLLQQGRVLLDADWNEQAEITAHHDEVRTRDVVGRSGGTQELPDGKGGAGFAVVGPEGERPEGVAWEDLRITTGRYYVDGLLCEAAATAAPGWSLADQPHLPTVGGRPGLPEPQAAGRHALYLEVRDHLVTADEDSSLLEPALGGPDTTVRQRTLWQVRCVPLGDGEQCSDLHVEGWQREPAATMAAQLRVEPPGTDPCLLTTGGGYTRLENQLYRVQVHEPGDGTAPPTFLWSRENGSVVACVTALELTTTLSDMDAVATLDREGRDDELAFRQGDLVELTSVDLQLRGEPGLLAEAGAPLGLDLPLSWRDGGPTSLQELGDTPLVRRWEGGPHPATSTATELEGGITVTFAGEGPGRTGDFWLVPARAVRLSDGIALKSGTLLWPQQTEGQGIALPPHGPRRHVTPLAVLEKTEAGWTLESDCRRLFPPLTELVTLDLVGGDGQEARPGQVLPEPVRVVVRNGGLPVEGTAVHFATTDGGALLASADGNEIGPDVETTDLGVAEVWWSLNPSGPTTQRLRITRLDDHGEGVGVVLAVTGRLSVAEEVAWSPPDCEGFAQTATVQDALTHLVTTAELRLLGGDGQHAHERGTVLPHPVRVVLDSPCGPVQGGVVAQAGPDGLLRPLRPDESRPDRLDPGQDGRDASTDTDADGVAGFWWQPGFAEESSEALVLQPSHARAAPLSLSAQLLPAVGRRPGLHVESVRFRDGEEFLNDQTYSFDDLARGIDVELDAPVREESVAGKPVMRVQLDLPWPSSGDWASSTVGYQTVELGADLAADGALLRWSPWQETGGWLQQELPEQLAGRDWQRPIVGRFVIDGWAVISAEERARHLNGHADTRLQDGVTVLRLPTDDEVAGRQFVQWFRLERQRGPVLRLTVVPDVVGETLDTARALIEQARLRVGEVSGIVGRSAKVARTKPAAGRRAVVGSPVDIDLTGRIVIPQ